MTALQVAIMSALTDRRESVLAAGALYGATVRMLMDVLEPLGVDVGFEDFCDPAAVERAAAQRKPGCILMETVSNPLLRVPDLPRIAEIAKAAGAALVVDNTFATPLLIRPLEVGAAMVVHSLTKYLAGHGDVLGGAVVCDRDHLETVRTLSRTCGPVLGPFEAYLTMRGIKTFALRVERQNQNACRVASWLAEHPQVERVFFPADPKHPDAATIAKLFPRGMYGAMVSFEIAHANRERVFEFMDRLKLIVRATSLGDVHSMLLYPAMSSHRDISPKQRERMGIRENLVRLSLGIEAVDDIIADLDTALSV
jgi:cystathionine gamma-synthase/methionine-gamma-lyase